MRYDGLVARGYHLILIAPLASSVLGCTSFSAAGSDGSSGTTADASPPIQQDASTSTGDGGPAPPVCNGWTFCDDFEGATFPSMLWKAKGTIGSLEQAPDLLGSGKALRAQGPAGMVGDSYLLASMNLLHTFTFALRVRAASPRTDFAMSSYVEVLKLECGASQRAFGVLLDNRGLTLQLDSNNGDFPGFGTDTAWHELSVTVGPTATDVVIDSKPYPTASRNFAPRDCTLLLGARAGLLPQPYVDVYVDDIRGK